MERTVIDMCPFMGLTYIDVSGEKHYKGEGLFKEENKRLDAYFTKFYGKSFKRNKSIELAQMALDNIPIPKGWNCSTI